jgi:hypothetical protein
MPQQGDIAPPSLLWKVSRSLKSDIKEATMISLLTVLLAMAECLSKELALMAPAIKVLIVEPGYYGTHAFRKLNLVPARQADYAAFNAGTRAQVDGIIGNEPGDPAKAVERMIELVKGTGMAAGKTIPLRVPLGSDGWARVKEKCEDTLRICEEWQEVAKSTDR